MSFNPEQPRDEHGKWTEAEHAKATEAANEVSRMADDRDEELGDASGYNRHHGEAAALYGKAAEIARGIAERHRADGNESAAQHYEGLAKSHDTMATRHASSAGANESYKAAQNRKTLDEAKSALAPSTNRKAAADKIRHARNAEQIRESDQAVRDNLEPHLRPAWDAQKSTWNALKMNPEARERAFREYVHGHEREIEAGIQTYADRKLKKLIDGRDGLNKWASRVSRGKTIDTERGGERLDRWAEHASQESGGVPF